MYPWVSIKYLPTMINFNFKTSRDIGIIEMIAPFLYIIFFADGITSWQYLHCHVSLKVNQN